MSRLSDGALVTRDTNLASVPFGLVAIARLKSGSDIINKTRYSGKRFSSLVIAEGLFDYGGPDLGHSIMMALGQQEGEGNGTLVPGAYSNWLSLGQNTLDAAITPDAPVYPTRTGSDAKPSMGATGDWDNNLSALEISVVPVTALLDGASAINNRHYSGKGRGRFVIADDGAGVYELVYATGGLYSSLWRTLAGVSLGAIVGGPMPDESLSTGDGKHTAYNPLCVSLTSSFVTNAELADIASDINAKGVNEGGKRKGAIYFAADDWAAPTLANEKLVVANDGAADSYWSNLDGVGGFVTPA